VTEAEVDPHEDLIGRTFTSNYRGRFDFTTEVTGCAPWNAAYVNVNVTDHRTGKVTPSSRRVEHVRQRLAAQPAPS
jgi:protocatechuate 3,4-dioxygenase beta subunit